MRDELGKVKRASARRDEAERAYRSAVVSAVTELEHAGVRDAYSRVADAAGVSRQAVRQLVERAR